MCVRGSEKSLEYVSEGGGEEAEEEEEGERVSPVER